jgi:hypothetical protein
MYAQHPNMHAQQPDTDAQQPCISFDVCFACSQQSVLYSQRGWKDMAVNYCQTQHPPFYSIAYFNHFNLILQGMFGTKTNDPVGL